MTVGTVATPIDAAVAGLREAAPDLVEPFRAALPAAGDLVARRLLGALHREGLASHPAGVAATRHAFDRIEVVGPLPFDPFDPIELLGSATGGAALAGELSDAVVGLALGYARRVAGDAALRRRAAESGARDLLDLAAALPADEQVVLFERLSTDGHNLHPCGRTRLGWTVTDRLAHDLESPGTSVGFVALRRDLHVGDDLSELLAGYGAPAVPGSHVVQPVHAWQLSNVLPERYADLLTTGALRILDAAPVPAATTAALRTLLLPPHAGAHGAGQADAHAGGARRYLKLSLDIQVTSTRRSISVASTRNGPALSAVLHDALAAEPRVLLMAETAGAAGDAGAARDRDLAAIVRSGLSGRLSPGEIAVPGSALAATSPLTGRTVLAELVARYAAARGRADDAATAAAFFAAYAALLLPPLLRLAARSGIGFEAHLQNSIPTFVNGVPHRIALRDFAGLRLHRPRLERAHGPVRLWPGSVVGTDDVDVMRAKLAYTALQAHLGEVAVLLTGSHGLDEHAAWRSAREVVDAALLDAGPEAVADHNFLTAPTVPHKALVRMRLAGQGDVYVPVRNPLA